MFSITGQAVYCKLKYLTYSFTFDLRLKVTKCLFLFSFLWLLYNARLSKIDQAVQDLSQNEIFDL